MKRATVPPFFRPSLNLTSDRSLETHALVNYTRTGTQTYFDSNGVLQTAPANELPVGYEYNSATGLWERKGWYIGESRTNLIDYSEAADLASSLNEYSAVNTIINSGVDTLNGITFDEIEINTGETSAALQNLQSSLLSNTDYADSLFVREGSLSVIQAQISAYGFLFTVEYDLVSGTATEISSNISFDFGIDNINGAYRCWYELPVQTDTSGVTRWAISGVAGDTIKVGGYQFEQGSFPSPYIKTEGSQVTRGASLADITDLSWYNQDEGTFVVEGNFEGGSDVGSGRYLMSIDNGNVTNNSISIYNRNGSAGSYLIFSGNSIQTVFNGLGATDALVKTAVGYKVNDAVLVNNGSVTNQDSTVTVPTGLTTLRIGVSSNSEFLNGYLKSLKYYPKRLSNSQLQSLTS
jgi:hypothetical protein